MKTENIIKNYMKDIHDFFNPMLYKKFHDDLGGPCLVIQNKISFC